MGSKIPCGSTSLDAYNNYLTKSSTTLSQGIMYFGGSSSVGSYIIFAGGRGSWMTYNRVAVVNSSLSQISTSVTLSEAKELPSGGKLNNYALFAGGRTNTSSGSEVATVEVFNSSLTISVAPSLSIAKRCNANHLSFGDYVLFPGGTSGSSTYTNTVDMYDGSLTHSLTIPLSVARYDAATVIIGNYGLYAGGKTNSSTSFSTVDVYEY